MIGDFIAGTDAFATALRRGTSINVNDQSSKDQAIALATQYFKELRPVLIKELGENPDVLKHDERWQQIVRLAHGNNARRTYFGLINAIKRDLTEFSIASVSSPQTAASDANSERPPTPEELAILRTLDEIAPSAAASYRQGLTDLNEIERLSYRGTASEFRESLRECLDQLAPDEEVKKQDWYKPEGTQTHPTMKQKARYILKSRGKNKTQRSSAEKVIDLVEELSGEVARAIYNRASLATHIHQSKTEVQTIKRYVDTVFFDLLEITT